MNICLGTDGSYWMLALLSISNKGDMIIYTSMLLNEPQTARKAFGGNPTLWKFLRKWFSYSICVGIPALKMNVCFLACQWTILLDAEGANVQHGNTLFVLDLWKAFQLQVQKCNKHMLLLPNDKFTFSSPWAETSPPIYPTGDKEDKWQSTWSFGPRFARHSITLPRPVPSDHPIICSSVSAPWSHASIDIGEVGQGCNSWGKVMSMASSSCGNLPKLMLPLSRKDHCLVMRTAGYESGHQSSVTHAVIDSLLSVVQVILLLSVSIYPSVK